MLYHNMLGFFKKGLLCYVNPATVVCKARFLVLHIGRSSQLELIQYMKFK